MDMFIRIYYEGCYKDISLNGLNRYSIGCGKTDDFKIISADLGEQHIVITKNEYTYEVNCNGCVFLGKNQINRTILAPAQMYILSRQYKISMLVIKEYEKNGVEIELNDVPGITIGRSEDNDITLTSPIVSGHHARIANVDGAYQVQDLQSMNGTYINGKISSNALLTEGTEIVIGDIKAVYRYNMLTFYGIGNNTSAHATERQAFRDVGGTTLFKRSPRLKLEIPTGEIEIQAPPTIGFKPEIDKLGMFMPLIVTVGIAVLISVIMKNPYMMLYSLPMQLVSGFMSFRSYKKQTSKYQDQENLRLKKYNEHLENAVEVIEEKREEQISAMVLADPDTKTCFKIAENIERRLWERRPSDVDFACIRVGTGDVEFSLNIKVPKSSFAIEEDELKQRPQEIYDKFNMVKDVPITCSLPEYQICGIIGNHNKTLQLVKNMIVQATTHHSHEEVRLVVICDEKDSEELSWVRQLPHILDDDGKFSSFTTTKEEAVSLFRNYEKILKSRKMELESDNSYGSKVLAIPYYIFVITAPGFLAKNNPITDYLFRNKELRLGVGVLFVVDDIVQLPPECELIIEYNKEWNLYNKNNVSHKQQFIIDKTDGASFAKYGNALNKIRCESTDTKNAIPKNYSFYEMLGIDSAAELDIESNWERADVINTVSAPLGIYGQRELLYLDLHERSHGPHGLVAGKTGSGKSEVMLSYLVAMATRYSPYEVEFLIIDFKGGGMSDRLVKLPHLNATITNIDGSSDGDIDEKVIKRSLASIKAESLNRQRLLAEAGAIDISDYLEKYKQNKVSHPLPHLIIVVDEFAELKQNYPEFMKELISTSRIGRSLGMHLILATQTPAGVVDEQIWSNSNFKLSLMVNDESGSNAVLKSPLAARITDPGRGYLKVGNGEVFELFQSGYSGAKVSGRGGEDVTQLEAVINEISSYCNSRGIERLPSICPPPLSHKIMFDDELMKEKTDSDIPLGMYDDIDNQYQGVFNLDVFNQNTFIIGSARSGKSNVLQVIIKSLMSNQTPKDVNIYILDFSTGFMKIFESSNHVGGVVTKAEDEKLKNLIKLINRQIEIRKRKFLEIGVSSFSSYKESGRNDLPQMVLIIDNFISLKELYFNDNDELINICQNGLSYGISVIATNAGTNSLNYKYLPNFAQKIALYCNDSMEYNALFEHCDMRIQSTVGRCIVEHNTQFYECQSFLAYAGDKEFERSENIRKHIAEENSKHNSVAIKIPEIPEVVTVSFIKDNYPAPEEKSQIALGVDYSSVEPLLLDVRALGTLAIVGRAKMGKKNFLSYFVSCLENLNDISSDVYVIDNLNRNLAFMKNCSIVKQYEFMPEPSANIITGIEAELKNRYETVATGDVDVFSYNTIVLIINGNDTIETISADSGLLNLYKNITGKYKNMGVCVILSDIENVNITFSSPEIIRKAKEDRNMLFFEDMSNMKLLDMPFDVVRKYKKPLNVGECYRIKGNDCYKVKTPIAEDVH